MSKNVLTASILAIPTFWCSLAYAQTAVTLTQLQHVDFGTVPGAPSRCAIGSNAMLSGDCIGVGRPGEIEVAGEPHYAYNVSVSSLGWINDIFFRPSLDAKRFSLDRQGRDVFTVTGDLRFKPNYSQTGTIVFTYLITVDYQ